MPRIIKRYDNRKLYDTQDKRYVSLKEVADLVRAGEEVSVSDNASGADITAPTLAKIIIEESSGNRVLFQTQFLHEMVRRGGEAVSGGVEQLQHGLERLVQASLERVAPVQEIRSEMVRLQRRLDELETRIQAMSMEEEREHKDGSAG